MSEIPKTNLNQFLIPVAILFSGILIAVAIFFSDFSTNPKVVENIIQEPTYNTAAVRPVSPEDHIKGDPNAPFIIVEYSDYECPFCQRVHDTFNEIVATSNGEVAWVFRQFPLEQLHPVKAMAVAVASECAAEVGGNEAFWQFTDAYFDIKKTSLTAVDTNIVIPKLISDIGIDANAFNTCVAENRPKDKIASDIANAQLTGGTGTPWSILIGPDGQTYPINGALPVQSIRSLIEIAREG